VVDARAASVVSATAATTGGPTLVGDAAVRQRRITIGLWAIVVVTAIGWAVPLVFMIFTSLKPEREIFEGTAYLPPRSLDVDNYREAWDRGKLFRGLKNSALISVIKVPAGLVVSSLAAFALTRLRFTGQRALLAVIALGAMVPIQVALAPLFNLMLDLGLLNSRFGIMLPYLAFGIPYQVFILAGFFGAVPTDLDEAARIDGTSNLQLYLRIILPLAKPALAALFILDFVATWNEYAIASVLLQDQDVWTIPLSIQNFNTQFTSLYGPLNGYIFMSVLPVLVVYVAFQKYFVSGTFAGAVKG
jgi:raffinose/stachyose/melibiose transport system permease protein